MDLYFIRHADALPEGEQGITEDATRPLSNTGWQQARDLAAGLQRHKVTLDLVLTSPLLRARQTAEEMLRHWAQPAPQLQVCEELLPEARSKQLAKFLRGLQAGSVALVGHQPSLGEHAGWFIGSRKARLDLAKAGVACVTLSGRPRKKDGSLAWLVTPQWLKE